MLAYFWVAVGGALGSVARFWVGDVVSGRVGGTFPWGTLLVNVSGSFVIGILGALTGADGKMDSPSRILATQFVMAGLCGGYTTFSSFSWQTLQLLQNREWLQAGGNVAASVILCLTAVWLGWMLGAALNLKGN